MNCPVDTESPAPDHWHCGNRILPLTGPARVMGIVNVTPDSFYDGGRSFSLSAAARQALCMVEEGADILDIGGESSRPGAEPVSVDEELRRIIPVIERVVARSPVAISVDTRKAAVAREALAAGACVVNDIAAGDDEDMEHVVRESGAGWVLMHMQGTPRTMQQQPAYREVTNEVASYLKSKVDRLVARGLPRERLVIDPGIGFGKSADHNWTLLSRLREFTGIAPVLVGASRKRFLGDCCGGGDGPDNRLAASLGVAALAIAHGARIIRVHDVKETCDVARVVDKMHSESPLRTG